uniref:Uncharacterized protein n=1 Tax=Panagrolaimus sp. ES5 TaxID=591445 RepID=A0AC34F0Y1_9BILA
MILSCLDSKTFAALILDDFDDLSLQKSTNNPSLNLQQRSKKSIAAERRARMNLSSYHCKLLQRTWKEMREEKFKQIERPILWSLSYSPDQALIYKPSTSLGVTYTWNDKLQQDLYEIVLAFVDTAMKDLKQRELRLQLRTRCRRFGRQMAAAFRAMDIDQSLSWEMLGQSMLESFATSFRNNATKIFLWQLFLEHISAMVFEAFCWAVARDYTSTPLQTIYETDLKQCFPHLTTIERKTPILKKIIAKFARFSKSVDGNNNNTKKVNIDDNNNKIYEKY